jgi:hypothetical protein
MSINVEWYLPTTATASIISWNNIPVQAGWWYVAAHGATGGSLAELKTPSEPPENGPWELLTQIDAGSELPKWKVWVAPVTTTGTTTHIDFTGPGNGISAFTQVWVLSGLPAGMSSERLFSPGVAASATAQTSQAVPDYAPGSGLLMAAWMSGSAADYTVPAGMTAQTEQDGTTGTSRAATLTLSARESTTRTATSSVAAPWAAFSVTARDTGGPATFPGSPISVRTELALGATPDADPATWAGLWTDVTADLRSPISITRGRGDEASTVGPSSMSVKLANDAGKYSRLNPTGPYYGLLNKNTPIRTWIDFGAGPELRYTGFVSEWPPRQQGGDVDQHIQVTAAGVTRRMQQGKTLRSAIFRSVTSGQLPNVVGYWPLESDTSSGLPGGRPLRVKGTMPFTAEARGGTAGFVTPPTLADQLSGSVQIPASTTGYIISFWVDIPADLPIDGSYSTPAVTWTTPGSTHDGWYAIVSASSVAPGVIVVDSYQTGVDEQTITGSTDLRGLGPTMVSVHVQRQDATTVRYGVYINGVLEPHWSTFTDTFALPASVGINNIPGIGGDTQGSISHLVVSWYPFTTFLLSFLSPLATAGTGYLGERAADRIRRLAAEEGLTVDVAGDDGQSEPMGPQPVDTLLNILRDCETADGGVLYERRDGRLAYATRAARYNATPVITLDYSAGHVAPPFEPTDDDQASRNDVTASASRSDGGSARVTDEASISTIGLYDDSVTVNVTDDDQLPHQAGWRVHLGTSDDYRYPQVTPNLNGKASALMADWAGVDVSRAIRITNPASDLPPGPIDLFAEGYSETIDTVSWTATANCSPGAPWRVVVLDDAALGRVDTAGSALAASATSTASTLSVATSSGQLWTTSEADMPVDIIVGGEQMTVTAIGQTINSNAYFVTDASGWTGFNSTIARSTAQVHPNGVASALITPDGTSATGGINSVSTAVGSITAGQSYTAVLWVYSPGGWSDIRPGIDWQDSAGALISNAFGAQTAAPAGMWTRMSVTLTAPAGVSRAVVRGRHAGTPAAGDIWYAWGIRLIPAGSPQQMTVIRSANGVVKAHGSGEDVRLAPPPILAL